MPCISSLNSDIKGQSLPPNATSPSSAQIGDVVYILGGRATDSNRIPRAGCDGQIRWLDLKAEQPEWKRANRPLGSNPGPLYGHTLSAYQVGGKDYLIVLGGVNLSGRAEHQISIWDVEQERWLDLPSPDEPENQEVEMQDPKQDSNSDEQVVSDEISLESLEDEIDDHIIQKFIQSRRALVEKEFSYFSPRFLHTATVVYSSGEPFLFVVGGFCKTFSLTQVLGTVQILNLSTLKWSPIFRIPQRYSHSSLPLDQDQIPSNSLLSNVSSQQLLLFGGRDELGSHNSIEESLLLDVNEYLNRWRSWEEGRDDLSTSDPTAFSSIEELESGLDKLSIRKNDGLWRRLGRLASEDSQMMAGKGRAEIKALGSRLVVFGECMQVDSSSRSIQMQAFVLDLPTGSCASLGEVLPEHLLNHSNILTSTGDDQLKVISFGSLTSQDSSTRNDSIFHLSESHLDDALGFKSSKSIFKSSLSTDLHSLLHDQGEQLYQFPDFQFISSSKPDSPIYAHRLILLARWPHLRTLLDSGMKESQDNKLVFNFESPEAIKSFVHFLYTDDLPLYLTNPHKKEVSHSIYNSNDSLLKNQEEGKVWRTLLSLMSLSSLYSIPRLFQLSSNLLKKSFISTLNVGRIYSASLKLVPAQMDCQVSSRGQNATSFGGDEMSKLTREWVQELTEFCLPRLKTILSQAEDRKSMMVALTQDDTSLYSHEDVEVVKEIIEEEVDILLIGLGRRKEGSTSFESPNSLPQFQLHSPNGTSSMSSSTDSATLGQRHVDSASPDQSRKMDYQKLLIQVTARLNHVKQTNPSINQSSRSLDSNPRPFNEREGYSGFQSPALSTTIHQRSSPNSISSPISRVTFSLADVSSGRATPDNRNGRVVSDENLALDHFPETLLMA